MLTSFGKTHEKYIRFHYQITVNDLNCVFRNKLRLILKKVNKKVKKKYHKDFCDQLI